MSTQAHPLRRTVFIKKAFQGRFVAAVLLNLLLFAVVSAGLLYWLISDDLEASRHSAHLSIETLWAKIGFVILAGNLVAGLIAGVTAARTVIRKSHLIAGPLYRFEQVCRQVGEGRLDVHTGLRESDELRDLSTAFTAMVEGLRGARDRRAMVLVNAQHSLAELKALRGTDADAARLIDAVNADLARLRET